MKQNTSMQHSHRNQHALLQCDAVGLTMAPKDRSRYLANLARTEKSRRQIAVNRATGCQKKTRARESEVSAKGRLLACGTADPDSYSARLSKTFFSHDLRHVQQTERYTQNAKLYEHDRARCVYSAIKAFVSMVMTVMEGKQPKHVLNCCIVDDCSTRMRGPAGTDRTTVYTVMNSVQSLHIRDCDFQDISESCVTSFSAPTPLVILEQADASTISMSAMATAFITATFAGIGQLFSRFGIPDRIFQDTPGFRTHVFIADSLRANDKAFDMETAQLLQRRQLDKSFEKNLLLQIRCCTHQVALIRKPVVLLIPRFWSTLVRISHLYELMSFRKHIASTLTSIICSNFLCVQSDSKPNDMDLWKQRAQALQKTYLNKCQSVKSKLLGEILAFLNGDLSQQAVVHYCTYGEDGRPCCADSREALSKALRLLVRFFSSGYAPPLLYRFKHYQEAVGFIQMGCAIHGILPRALTATDSSADAQTVPSDMVEALLGDMNNEINQDVVDDLANSEQMLDFQHATAKRKQQVKAEVGRASFAQAAYIVNVVIAPMDHIVNRLFHRSSLLSKLIHLGTCSPEWHKAVATSKELFLDLMSGRLGWNMVASYEAFLHDWFPAAHADGFRPSATLTQTAFTMAIICMSDSWRRFVHRLDCFPHSLFQLLECKDTLEFCRLWDGFQEKYATCKSCVDCQFSEPLLCSFPKKLADAPSELQEDVRTTVCNILHDVAVYSPISSDPVEVKNGMVQAVTSRRGNQAVKAPIASRETSFLKSLQTNFQLVQHFVDEATLPARRTVSSILKRAGVHEVAQQQTRLTLHCPYPGSHAKTLPCPGLHPESKVYWPSTHPLERHS